MNTRHDRRRFLGTTITTIGAVPLGLLGAAAAENLPRELAAIAKARDWINSPRLTASDLAGRVVLLDFWTYTCINWMRTHPYIRAWARTYRHDLIFVGVHTPEFPFEREIDNVRRAVQQLRVEYPVVLDSDYAIWRACRNEYWPALYLFDAQGRARHHHFGEGGYAESEMAIQRVLTDAGASGGNRITSVDAAGFEMPADLGSLRSPENYLGYERAEGFASPGGSEPERRRNYAVPLRLALNQWALAGAWTIGRQVTRLDGPSGRIAYRFHARDLHLVMSPPKPGSTVRFRVSLDGQPPGAAHGLDTDEGGNGAVVEPRLYQLIRQRPPIVDRQFEVEFLDAGAQAYSFTFG